MNYSFKELLSALDHKLDRVLEKLETKADKATVDSLETRVTTIERHGSPAASEAVVRMQELAAQVAALDRNRAEKAYVFAEHEQLKIDVAGLASWRNRLAGAVAVLGTLGIVSVARLFGLY